MLRRQVNLSQTPVGQGDVDLHKVKETGQGTALTQPRPGLLAPGHGAPNNALRLGKRAPTSGDGAENPADRHLGRRPGIERDKGGIRVLAIPIALPNSIPALTRFRNLQNSHNRFTADPYHIQPRLSITFPRPSRSTRLARVVIQPAPSLPFTSGAILIEAFNQLHAVYDLSNARLEELRGQRTLFDLDHQILQNALYGVDLDEEAIQICQLSLWIKTAAGSKRLTSLDHTIREGKP